MDKKQETLKINQHIHFILKWVIFLLPIISLCLLYKSYTFDAIKNPFNYSIWYFLFTVSSSFIPLLFVAVFIKPINDYLSYNQKFEEKDELDKKLRSIINEQMNNLQKEVSNISGDIKRILPYSQPIIDFYSDFNNANWPEILEGSREIDIAIFYWSRDWYTRNKVYFERAVKNGSSIKLFLPEVEKIDNRFYTSTINEFTASKIIRTAQLLYNINVPKEMEDKIQAIITKNALPYVMARVKKDNDNIFLYSPLQTSDIGRSGLPPAIAITENSANPDVSRYIEQELKNLNKNCYKIPNFEKEKFINWDELNSRVIVSMSLICNAGCCFCYRSSLLKASKKIDPLLLNNLGKLLAFYLVTDNRFIKGIEGTKILIGGYSDPFSTENFKATKEFINIIATYKNPIHLSTRIGVNNRDIDLKNKNITINYSVSTFDQKYEGGNGAVILIKEAGELLRKGIKTALYLRPIIPSITIKDTPKFIEILKSNNLKDVVIGSLYFDDLIRNNMEKRDLKIPYEIKITDKKHVLDPLGILSKLDSSNEINEIKSKLVESGFNVFESSNEIIKNIQQIKPKKYIKNNNRGRVKKFK